MGRYAALQNHSDVSRQHRPSAGAPVPALAPNVLRSSGEPLGAADAGFAGSRLNFDFSNVRIHSDERAAQSAAAIGASAYTYGSHVVFGGGRYQPRTSEGSRLLMHELTHVVQQSGAAGSPLPSTLDDPQGPAEQAAVRHSDAALAGEPASPLSQTPLVHPTIQRQAEPAKTEDAKETPNLTAAAANTTPGPAPGTAGQTSQWNLEDPHVDFSLSNQVSLGASFRIAGSSKARGPGFSTWSNPGVFKIVPHEHSWLHTNYWADTPEHPIPWDAYKPAVFNEIKFTSSGGAGAVTVRYDDDHPIYQGPGKALKVNLGSTSPGASDLPIHDLPLNGGGSLVWRAGFRFGPGGWSTTVDGKFELQSQAQPASAIPTATSGGGSTVAATAGAAPAPAAPGSRGKPLPPAVVPSPKSGTDAVRDIQIYTEGIKKVQDAVARDELVRRLRDALSAIQPVLPAKDAQKLIDEAIRSLVKDGVDAGIMAILKLAAGKSPSAMPPGGSTSQIGPYPPSGVPGERTIPGPKLPIPDTPKPTPRFSFQYRGLRKTYAPGESMKITVLPPEKSDTMRGAKRVVVVADADRNEVNPARVRGPVSVSDSATSVDLKAPDAPGKYVIRVEVGLNFDYSSIEEFEVKPAGNP